MKRLLRLVLPSCSLVVTLSQAFAGILINEIHYNPDVTTEPAEFVELINAGTNTVNLACWSLSSGFNFTFPATNLAPGKFVVVAQNPAFLQTKFSIAGVLGPFNADGSSGLSKYGDKVTLRDATGKVQDEVSYQAGFPWPTVGDPPGCSIELINPNLDNDLGGNWRASTNAGTARPTPGSTNRVYALNAPPAARQVEHHPKQPMGGQPVTITAKVTDPDGVASVVLQYQIVDPGGYIELTDAAYNSAANWISVPMNDSGTDGDAVAGDDVYTCVLSGKQQVHRRLIRYRITVTDSGNRSVRVPYADDPQPNFAYFCYNGVPAWTGAVQPGTGGSNGVPFTVSAEEMNRLPVYQLITKSNEFAEAIGWAPGLPNNKYTGDNYLWTGTLVVDGDVYDHIGFRCRGGVWRYSMGKNAMKFRLNRAHGLQVKDNWGRKLNAPWRRLSFRPNIQQGDFLHRGEQGMFEGVGYRLFELAGAFGLKNVQLQFRVIDDSREVVPGNQYQGDFYGLWLAVEEEDGRFLEERDLPDGNVYDMEGGTGTLNNTGPNGPINKADLNYLLTYGAPTPTEAWWRTNLDLRSYYSYQAISQGIHQYDIADGKNYFYYRNPVTGLWSVWPWDLDLTWADNMYRAGQQGGDEPFKSRVLSNFANPGTFPAIGIEFRNRVREIRDLLFNTDEAFKLIDEYWWMTRGTNAYSIVDADRAFWDYNPVMFDANIVNLSKAGNYHFYQWQNEPGTSNNFGGAAQLMKNYVRYRSTNATFSLDTISADNLKPARPVLTYTGSGSYPINRLTFRSSNYSGSNPFASLRWRIAEVTDPAAPPFDPGNPRKYEIETVWESEPITSFNADMTIPAHVLREGSRYRVRVLHTDTTGRNSQWSLPQEFVVGPPANEADLLNYLRITEVMFNPPPDGYEFIELYNSSPTVTLDLSGVKFTQGVDYTFAQGTTLSPGAYLVLVGTSDIAGFRTYYGLDAGVTVIGPYSGGLNNAGEQLVLRTSAGGSDIVNFNYGDGRGWPPQADGGGHSLVLLDSAIDAEGNGAGEYAGNWRASTFLRGSPGGPDTVLPPGILLNEIVAHTDYTNELTSNDWIELFNPTDTAFVFGPGWYLSDDSANLKKWQVPSTNVIPAHGFITFYEATDFHFPTNVGFGLSKDGEQVFLSCLPGNAQDRVVDAVTFKAQENDWSLGRYPDGGAYWYALTPRTPNTTNAAPIAHVAISEFMFHPPDVLSGTNLVDNAGDEFIEIHNATPDTIALQNTNGTWRLNGGVDFVFPTNTVLDADAYLVVVSFNPATNAAQLSAFRSLYGMTNAAVPIVGPFSGKLANNSDRIALEKPQHPDGTNTQVSWVIVDEVLYADQSPWPCGSDGSGNSLQRLDEILHGSNPNIWSAEPPTAGRARDNLPAGLPVFTAQPQDRIVATNASVSFSVGVCGTPPFGYQWQFNGTNIDGATKSTLVLFNVTPADAGFYRVVVTNSAGPVTSAAASLIVQFPPFITSQPESTTTLRDHAASFSVAAGGTPPFNYQWRFNGLEIPGATNSDLLLTNVQSSQAGTYSVRVFNAAGSAFSSNVTLTVLIPATITQAPTNVTQVCTINPMDFVYNPTNVTMSVSAIGAGPLHYQWRFFETNLPGATNSLLVISNVNPTKEGPYTVTVTDDVGDATSPPAILTVLARPIFMVQPAAQTVLQGDTVTITCLATGAPPPAFRWVSNGFPVLTNLSGVFVAPNVQSSFNIRAAITNVTTGVGGVNSGTVTISVLADFDHDGMADVWEAQYGFSTNSAGDALIDTDGDGMINRDEYIAGTNPTDALSVLKLAVTVTNSAVLEFVAQSNLAYAIQYRTDLSLPTWYNLTNIAAKSGVRTIQVDTPNLLPPQWQRFYRVTTPPAP